jgi:hypothetical protein
MSKPTFDWRLFLVLLGGAILGLIAIVPYSLALQGDAAIAAAAAKAAMPLWLLIAIQLGLQVPVFAVAIWVGLSFARSIGLGLPLIEKWLSGERIGEDLRRILLPSIGLGVILALLIIALEVVIFQPALAAQIGPNALTGATAAKPGPFKGFLASFYGGIDEEILLRLCVMSFLAWLGRFFSKTPDGKPTLTVLWIANVLAAVLFGLGHLPATAVLVPLTPLIVARAIALNGLIGVGFGYLYFKHGLESAMISHFSADIVLHVLFAI